MSNKLVHLVYISIHALREEGDLCDTRTHCEEQ